MTDDKTIIPMFISPHAEILAQTELDKGSPLTAIETVQIRAILSGEFEQALYNRVAAFVIKQTYHLLIAALAGILATAPALSNNPTNTKANSKAEASTRPFYMGFSPWPYDLTLEAVQWTDQAVKTHGDIIEQHFEEGVPWPEALANKPYHPAMQQEITDRARRMGNYKRVVSINPLNMSRSGLAEYRGKACNMPLPQDWKNKRLNDNAVKQAYLQYCNQIIQNLHPDFLLIGVEVNLLQRCKDSSWQDYLELHRYIYSTLKKTYPNLPLMASVVCTSYFPGLCAEDNATEQRAKLKELLPYVDILGFSVHPFISAWTAEKVPDQNFFRELFALADGKPFAITESSYPAQKWQMKIGWFPVNFNGTQEKQATFLKAMLDESLIDKPRFICWYSIRDYDQLYSKMPNIPMLQVWRDTGLFDETGKPRQALQVWDGVLRKSLR